MTISERGQKTYKHLNVGSNITLLPSYVALANLRHLKFSGLDVCSLTSETLLHQPN